MSLQVNIKKKLKGFTLNISFETKGEYLGVLGASGCGKSMTLKCIAGIETPDEGEIILNGNTLFDSNKNINLKPQERNIGFLFQNYALFPHMTVEENIGIGLTCAKSEKEQRISEMINSFHLQGLEKKYPNQLSGGQQQRAALARSIIYKPDLLLLDEPFSALDSHLKDHLQTEVLDLLKLYHGEVLMVTHNRDEAYRLCKNLVVIDEGMSVLFGDTKEIFRQPKIISAARLTGCKNISKCEILTPRKLKALDWDICFDMENPLPEIINFIGIRAHEFKLLDISQAENETNVIKCTVDKIVEDVFEYNVYLKKGILYKVKKEEWDSWVDKDNLYLKVPDSSILLLE